MINNNNFILILFFLIILFIFYKYNNIYEGIRNTFYFDNDSNYEYIDNIDKIKCPNFDCKNNNDQILLIGKDINNNNIFKYENQLYNINNEKLILYKENDDNKVYYYNFPIKVPIDLSNMKIKIKMVYDDYNYIGILSNNYYNIEYLLYEKSYDLDDTMDDKLYYYILVKIIDNNYKIMYKLPPRTKILPEEYIWASYGSFQIGPLFFN